MDPLERISEIFAESVFSAYKKQRYGIKSCKIAVDPEYANDLRLLLIRSEEMDKCNRVLDNCCTLTTIKEKIKTL